VRIGAEEYFVWRFMADLSAPQAPPKQGSTLKEYFERYKREVIPGLAPNTQINYAHSLAVLEKAFGHNGAPRHDGGKLRGLPGAEDQSRCGPRI